MFDINKYKDWYWCETMEGISIYFLEIDGAEELPIEFAQKVVTDFEEIIPIENKPNHYHKKFKDCVGERDYVIYAFKNKKTFQNVARQYTEYINLKEILKSKNITFDDFLKESEKKTYPTDDMIYCAKCISLTISDTSIEDYNDVVPISAKKYLEAALKILINANKNNELDTFINDCKYYLVNDLFLCYHDFNNFDKKIYF